MMTCCTQVLNARAELASASASLRTAQADTARAEGGASVLRAAAEEAESRHASKVKVRQYNVANLVIS